MRYARTARYMPSARRPCTSRPVFAPLRGVGHSHGGRSVHPHVCRSPIFADLDGSFFPTARIPRHRGFLFPSRGVDKLRLFPGCLSSPETCRATSYGMKLAPFLTHLPCQCLFQNPCGTSSSLAKTGKHMGTSHRHPVQGLAPFPQTPLMVLHMLRDHLTGEEAMDLGA